MSDKIIDIDDMELTNVVMRPRPQEAVEILIPIKALADLDVIAERRKMSREALLRFYIGQGLRADLTQSFADHVLDKAASVLARHQLPIETVDAIIREMRHEAATMA